MIAAISLEAFLESHVEVHAVTVGLARGSKSCDTCTIGVISNGVHAIAAFLGEVGGISTGLSTGFLAFICADAMFYEVSVIGLGSRGVGLYRTVNASFLSKVTAILAAGSGFGSAWLGRAWL